MKTFRTTLQLTALALAVVMTAKTVMAVAGAGFGPAVAAMTLATLSALLAELRPDVVHLHHPLLFGLDAIDSPFAAFRDMDGLRESAARARAKAGARGGGRVPRGGRE